MKKIWFINQYANTPDMTGHTRQYEIAEGLTEKGWKVDIYASDFNLSERRFKRLNPFQISLNEKTNGINCYWLRVLPYSKNNWKRYLNMLSFCIHLFIFLVPKGIYSLLIFNSPKFIIASSPQLPAAFTGLLIAKLLRKPFIVEIRDLWPQILIDHKVKHTFNFLIRILKWMEMQIYKNASYVIVLAQGSKNYVKKRGAKRILWLPNGPDLKKIIQIPLPIEKAEFSINNPFTILYAGTHGEVNGLENIIDAAKLLLNYPIKILLVGDGSEKRNLIKYAADLPNIIFKDPVPKNKILDIIGNANAILISLRDIDVFNYGISPNKLYDAYAVGRPVITTVNGDIKTEVEANCLGVTAKPEDPIDLAKTILKLYSTSYEDRKLMADRARSLAEKYYSREKIINSFHDLLTDLGK